MFSRLENGFLDDRGGVQAPESYSVEYFDGEDWKAASGQKRSPEKAAGGSMNAVRFDRVSASKVRLVCTHKGQAKSGVTEMEVWND